MFILNLFKPPRQLACLLIRSKQRLDQNMMKILQQFWIKLVLRRLCYRKVEAEVFVYGFLARG